jgi:tetratricopeptide (TPR) repeat protein
VPDTDVGEELEYFIEHVRLLLDGKTMEGLSVWAQRFSELRQISQFELCQRLANAIRTADLPEHGLGVVRYSEGWLYDRMGKWQEAIKAYKASLTAFQHAGIPLDATLLTQIGSIYQDQGDCPAAEEAYQQALAAATDAHARALTLNNLGNLALSREDATTAEQHYSEARELLRDHDKRNFAAATHGLAAALLDRGLLQESQDTEVECLGIFQALGDMHGVGAAVGGIATAQLYAGRHREAVHNYEVTLKIFLEATDHVGTTRTLSNLAIAHQELGDYDTALEYLTQAIDGYREIGDRRGETAALVNLARLHDRNNDSAAARTAANVAKAACEQYGFPQELRRLPPALQQLR